MQPFDALEPRLIITAVESCLGVRLDGSIYPCASYVNRVYGVNGDSGAEYIVKFYRPDRWSFEAIAAEHAFLRELSDAEVPVVPPLEDEDGDTLFEIEVDDGEEGTVYPCAIFPKRGGRTFDAEDDDHWLRLGALVGRMHGVGAQRDAPERILLDPSEWGGGNLDALVADGSIHEECRNEFVEIVEDALQEMETRFQGVPVQRIHGDCHRGNILDRRDEGLLLIDFDDMMRGPAVQDLWLLLPDHRDQSQRELTLLLDGYRQFRPLHEEQFELIEALRFLRMVHYLAWQARQRRDQHFQRQFPDWGSRSFWIKEVEDLRDQARLL